MRRFSSYGPIDPKLHYHAPRKKLIDNAAHHLQGTPDAEGGHYITVWAPRQTGKTWVMQEVIETTKQTGNFEAAIFSMESVKKEKSEKEIVSRFVAKLQDAFQKNFPPIKRIADIPTLFTKKFFQKPVILAIDEFDSLEENHINGFVSTFRDMFISRSNQRDQKSFDKSNCLHGLALIGVRSVLGIENVKGSPFNVQRSLHIPNLTHDEVENMFCWFQKETGRKIETDVVQRLFYETAGQPGLTCWFGELLTEGFDGYDFDPTKPIDMRSFQIVYAAATYALPNNNILNIISKAREESNKDMVLRMFQTDEKLEFKFDDKTINALYMNGIIEKDVVDHLRYYVKFSCPFVQKRLFNHFSYDYFKEMGTLVEPFTNLDDVINETGLNITKLIALYRQYLTRNKDWLFKKAPRRMDLKIYEAVYHFNLFSYLDKFLKSKGGTVIPEFPTGNGKIDLLVEYKNKIYGLELKSYTDQTGYHSALHQAAQYGKKLQLKEIYLLFFVPAIDDANRQKFEMEYIAPQSNVKVFPLFLETGN